MALTQRATDTRLAPARSDLLAPADGSTGRPVVGPSFVRGAMMLLSTQPLTWAATLLATMLLPRYLGTQGFGQYSLAITVMNLALVAAALGVPGYLTPRVAAEPERARTEGGSALILLIGTATLVAVLVGAALPQAGFPISDPLLLWVALANMVVLAAQQVVFALLIGQERHSRFAWLNAVAVVTGTLLGSAVLVAGGGAIGYLASITVLTAVVTGFGWHLAGFRLDRGALSARVWRHLVKGGSAFLGLNVALRIRNQIDLVLVGILLGDQAVGWLGAAYRIVWIPTFIPTLITTPLLPALSRQVGDRVGFRRTLRQGLVLVLLCSVPMAASIAAVAPWVPDLLGWGEAFQPSVALMQIIAAAEPIGAVDMVLSTALFALKQERRWLRVALLGAAFNPIMNLVLIPSLAALTANGAIIAAWVELATEILMFIGALWLIPRDMLDRATASKGARIVACGVCLAGAAFAARPLGMVPAVLIGWLAFVLVGTVLGVLTASEIRALRGEVTRVYARRTAG